MKKIIVLLISLCILLGLSGCHGAVKTVGFEVPETFDESKDYEITFWAKNDSNINQVNVYKKAIEDFEKAYPNIHVTLQLYTDYTKIYNDVITNISTNTTPNVCITYPDHIATYLTGNNTVLNLDEIMNDEKYGLGGSEVKFDGPRKEEMVKEFLDECIINGHYYALPYMRSTEALYINEDLVHKLGYEIPDVVTWDFVYEVSEKALKTNEDGIYEVNGQDVMIPFIYKSTDNMMISILRQLDGGYSNENGDIALFNDVTKSALKDISLHAKSGAFSTFKIVGYPANFLNAGKCIFMVDSTAGATWVGSDAPLMDIPEEKVIKFNTVVRPIPQYDENNKLMISQGPSVCIFNKDDGNEVLASWLFTQFLLTNDVQVGYGKTEGYLPVTTKAQNSEEYIEYLNSSGKDNDEHYRVKIDATKLLMENTDKTFVTPVFNGSASLRIAAGQLIEETVKATKRKKTVDDEFIDSLYSDINSLYRLDQVGGISTNTDLGELPAGSKALIITLACVWVLIGAYYISKNIKKR